MFRAPAQVPTRISARRLPPPPASESSSSWSYRLISQAGNHEVPQEQQLSKIHLLLLYLQEPRNSSPRPQHQACDPSVVSSDPSVVSSAPASHPQSTDPPPLPLPRVQSGGLAWGRKAWNELGLPVSSHISHSAPGSRLSPGGGAPQPPSPTNLPQSVSYTAHLSTFPILICLPTLTVDFSCCRPRFLLQEAQGLRP